MTANCALKLLESALPLLSSPSLSTLRSVQVNSWFSQLWKLTGSSYSNVIICHHRHPFPFCSWLPHPRLLFFYELVCGVREKFVHKKYESFASNAWKVSTKFKQLLLNQREWWFDSIFNQVRSKRNTPRSTLRNTWIHQVARRLLQPSAPASQSWLLLCVWGFLMLEVLLEHWGQETFLQMGRSSPFPQDPGHLLLCQRQPLI